MSDRDPDMMAAEFALGLLDGDDRPAAMRRSLSDPQFAKEVEWWRYKFTAMFDEYRPEPAPAFQIDRILPPPVTKQSGFRWAFVPLAGVVAASVALLLTQPDAVVQPPAASPSQQTMLAVLVPTDRNRTPFAASIDLTDHEVRVVAASLAPTGRDAQLWIIREGVPHSIGLLDRSGATRLVLQGAERSEFESEAVLAVSIEPLGGSPKPIPTGPVVASGTLSPT